MLAALFKEGDGKDFLKACEVLNIGKTGSAKRQGGDQSHEHVCPVPEQRGDTSAEGLVKLVGTCARLYVFGMQLWSSGLSCANPGPGPRSGGWLVRSQTR